MSVATLYQGDVLDILRTRVAPGSVQCVVTSPPYWGLRDYGTPPQTWGGVPACQHTWESLGTRHRGGPTSAGSVMQTRAASAERDVTQDIALGSRCLGCGAWHGHLGLEPTPQEYAEHVVEVFREIRAALRDDGTVWLNLGDSYTGTGGDYKGASQGRTSTLGTLADMPQLGRVGRRRSGGLKPKDLVGIPWRVAFALQADGWWLRSAVVWHKPNPMPESVTDRPTSAYELVFLLSKSESYYYDAEAIAEPAGRSHARVGKRPAGWASEGTHREIVGRYGSGNKKRDVPEDADGRGMTNDHQGRGIPWTGTTRNVRSVWPVAYGPRDAEAVLRLMNAGVGEGDLWTITTAPFPGAHFATFPEELARRCILAGSSPRACEKCGAPWERTLEREPSDWAERKAAGEPHRHGLNGAAAHGAGDFKGVEAVTAGWVRTCACENGGTGRCVVMDPFGGSGTTVDVAVGHGRDGIYVDLKPDYLDMARARIGPLLCVAGK